MMRNVILTTIAVFLSSCVTHYEYYKQKYDNPNIAVEDKKMQFTIDEADCIAESFDKIDAPTADSASSIVVCSGNDFYSSCKSESKSSPIKEGREKIVNACLLKKGYTKTTVRRYCSYSTDECEETVVE